MAAEPGVLAFLEWLEVEQGRAPNTVAAYRRDLAAYEAYLRESGVALGSVEEAAVEAYLRSLTPSGRAPATVARAAVAVRALHRFLVTSGLAARDPARRLSVTKARPARPAAPLAVADVEALIGSVSGDDALARRDRALLEVLYATGLRAAEVAGLELRDVGSLLLGRHAERALRAWLAAGGRPALIPEHAGAGDATALFLNARGRRLSRQGIWTIVRSHGQRAGLGGELAPSALRQACANHLVAGGMPPAMVSGLLGRDGRDAARRGAYREAYRAAHPRA